MTIYKTDYHIHSCFSDGKAPPVEYIAPALLAELKEIGFSEHLTLFKEQQDWSMNIANIPEYLTHIRHLRNIEKNIIIKTGLEVDYFPGREQDLHSFLCQLDLDYIIGSVHYLGENTVDFGPEFFEGKNIDNLYETYFDHVIAAIESGLFDIIAHCDLIRIFGFKPTLDPEPLYRILIKKMKIHDVTLEVNTNGRNRPLADFYPDRRFLHLFREENIPVCVNSDAHMPVRVGQHFDEAYELLGNAGYREMAVFEKRERYMIPFKI
jgi:histidinol-phosphatase (PHP family)